jgi:hypothetical protein
MPPRPARSPKSTSTRSRWSTSSPSSGSNRSKAGSREARRRGVGLSSLVFRFRFSVPSTLNS